MTAPLGTGQILGTTLGIAVTRLPVAAVASLPGLVVAWIAGWAVGEWLSTSFPQLPRPVQAATVFLVYGGTVGAGMGLIAGPCVRIVQGAIGPARVAFATILGGYLHHPAASVNTGALIGIACLLPMASAEWFGIPGGILVAVLFMISVAIGLAHLGLALAFLHVERTGHGALPRGRHLSAGYRVTLTGIFLVLLVVGLLTAGLIATGIAFVPSTILEIWPWMQPMVNRQRDGVIMGLAVVLHFVVVWFLLVGATVIRARLVEIREPLDIAPMVEVFD